MKGTRHGYELSFARRSFCDIDILARVSGECFFPVLPATSFAITALTLDGETEPSEEVCIDSFPMCEVTVTTPSPLPSGAFNAPYSFQLDQEFGLEATEQWSIIAGALPAGLTLSPSGLISGTPIDGGNFTFTANVFAMCDALSTGENSKDFLLNIAGGPEPTCILRIENYGTLLEPIFTAGPGGIVSTDPEWDGTFNLLNGLDTNGNPSSVPNNYWYQDGAGVFSNPLGVGPAIAVGGKAISRIYLSGPHPIDGGHSDPYWILEIIYVQFDGYVVWYGEKTDIPPAPLGTYLNPCVFVPSNCPAGGLSDNRPLINLEMCP